MSNGSLTSNVVFGKDMISHSNYIKSPVLKIWKHTNEFVQQGVFFPFIVLLQLRSPILVTQLQFSQHVHRCVILCIVWDSHRRVLVFDNYQNCPVPLSNNTNNTKKGHAVIWLRFYNLFSKIVKTNGAAFTGLYGFRSSVHFC